MSWNKRKVLLGPRDRNAWTKAELGKPDALPLGRQTARNADRAAGKGWRRKQRPLCNEADRGCAFHTATSPHAKACANGTFDDFRLVLDDRKGEAVGNEMFR